MALDHGILNLPLTKRGNSDFHKELDAHLKSEKRIAADKRFVAASNFNANKAAALEAFNRISDTLLKAEAKKRGVRARSLKKIIRETCSDNPVKAIKILELLTE
ncbi:MULTISPECIES: hypothetical protein [Yersinia]|uniref:Uncharacterized protein n=1 Tax=Yersinia hibernica TaxID=2339259 RepID=A0ABX5QYE7_9GAMM|nr:MULTISPECIES: hypothetical protein [Yersinia]EKN4882271.1 hypothetical protein [Yersinia enterocolitica]EKN4906625.1 hypothetical protein [Yersinia enterocolitica]EKN6092769.1 hypothetical protein [Yersinia enterocolitica]EKN6127792.1 hypothetical protein [Yersinia enterocolitica]ELI8480660.1 hypothetical protein [Yersinia enterocolitica]